jgi:hypothetical protein
MKHQVRAMNYGMATVAELGKPSRRSREQACCLVWPRASRPGASGRTRRPRFAVSWRPASAHLSGRLAGRETAAELHKAERPATDRMGLWCRADRSRDRGGARRQDRGS